MRRRRARRRVSATLRPTFLEFWDTSGTVYNFDMSSVEGVDVIGGGEGGTYEVTVRHSGTQTVIGYVSRSEILRLLAQGEVPS